jgi:hypothetical protein
MRNRTLRTIIILLALLFLNIEAAHAGLIHKFKSFIHQEFSDTQLIYLSLGLCMTALLLYIVFWPVPIGKEKWSWFHYYSYNPKQHFRRRKEVVRKISGILNSSQL